MILSFCYHIPALHGSQSQFRFTLDLLATSFAESKDPGAAAAKSLQSCPTLCDPIDGSPPGSPVPGILQARTLEWVAISFSNAWKWKVKVKTLSRVRLLVTPWTAAHRAPLSWDFPGKNTGVGATVFSRSQVKSCQTQLWCVSHRIPISNGQGGIGHILS